MVIFLFLLITEVLTFAALYQHFYGSSRPTYYLFAGLNILFSLSIWYLFIRLAFYKGDFDTSQNIWLRMNFAGLICGIVVPRLIFSLFHFTGTILKFKSRGHIRPLTNIGMGFSVLIMCIIAWGTFIGRFNFKTEEVTINIKGLDKKLDGFKIVQISDLHLPAFHNKSNLLEKVMIDVNSHNPDLVMNTGDFINYGWGEFGRTDTILSKAKGKYGNFAVLGNHDIGTYHPSFSDEEIADNISQMFRLIAASGYIVLDDENVTIDVEGRKIAILGIRTSGRHPEMIYGNLLEAMATIGSVDLKILLAHDPNQWEIEVKEDTDIDITLSGHTHGMQMGIYTEKFKWSPSKYYYPHWSGLYRSGNQYQYVNKGLGLLVIPFRIWMPPEITVITLKSQ